MKMHRAGKEAEWDSISNNDRNKYQKVAARTKGIITPGNVISVIGAGIAISGIQEIEKGKSNRGIVKLGIGRIADMLDGHFAEKTGTKSPIGEALDVILDKALMFYALPVLVKKEVLRNSSAQTIKQQNLTIIALSGLAKIQGKDIHPNFEGKVTTFSQWGTIGFAGLAYIADSHEYTLMAYDLEAASKAGVMTMKVLGPVANAGYVRDVLTPKL